VSGSRLHLGFLIGLVIIVAAGFVLSRTRAGLELKAVGLSPEASRFAGINVARTLVVAALISGAIAGMGGAGEVAGIQYRLTGGLSAGFGYTGIVVATLGGLRMGGVALVALLLGDLTVGASSAGRALGIPSQAGDIVQAAVLLVTVAIVAVNRYGLRRRRPAAAGAKP
jgi:simple sugar transport system permease protein